MTATTSHNAPPLDQTVVARYQRRMCGELLVPDHAVAEERRGVDNQHLAYQPDLIARCLSAHDVAVAIALARDLHLELAVRSGDYSQASYGVSTNGLLIDLSQLRQIVIDPLQWIAWVQVGIVHSELVQAAAAHGLAITTGICAADSVAGSVDNGLAFEIVTLEGTIITASAYEHSDLFSIIRSGNDTVGIVTAITYRLCMSQPEQQFTTGGYP